MKRNGSIISLINHLAYKGLLTVFPTVFLFFLLFLSSEDIIYSLQKSSREQLDGVQLRRNQRGKFQPSCFSVKENVIPGELTQSKRLTCQTRAPNKTKQFKGNCSVTRHLYIVPCGSRKEASGHFCVHFVGLYFSREKRGFAAGQQHLAPLAELAVGKTQGIWQKYAGQVKSCPTHPRMSLPTLVCQYPHSFSKHFLGKHSGSLVCSFLLLVSIPASFSNIIFSLKIGYESYFCPLSRDLSSQTPTGCRNELKPILKKKEKEGLA